MKLFVWDFHGTLEKGNEYAAIDFSNIALERLGYKERFSPEHVDLLYGKRWYEYFEFLLPNESQMMHVKLQELAYSLNESHWHLVLSRIKPNDYSHQVLEEVAQKHDQILISNTTPEALSRFVQAVEIGLFFPPSKMFGVDGHKKGIKSSKKDVLSDYLKVGEYQQIILIGDSEADMQMHEVAGGVRYLYAHPGKKHRDVEADYKISDLRQVLNSI